MCSIASSPSPAPFTPSPISSPLLSHSPSPSWEKSECITSKIIEQLSDKDPKVRFRCLATPSGRRCRNDYGNTNKKALYRNGMLDLQEQRMTNSIYVSVARILLFCDTHNESTSFKVQHYFSTLEKQWKGDGNAEEMKLLDLIREAYKDLEAKSAPKSKLPIPFTFTANMSIRNRSSTASTYLNTPGAPLNTARATGEHLEQVGSGNFASSSDTTRRVLPPSSRSRHTRSRSTAAQLEATEDKATLHAPLENRRKSFSESIKSDHQSGSTRSEAPSPNTTRSAPVISIFVSDIDTTKDYFASTSTSTSTSILASIPRAIPPFTSSTPFLKDQWSTSIWEFSPSLTSSHHSFNAAINQRSKDDSCLDQLSMTIAHATPAFFGPSNTNGLPPPQSENSAGKMERPYIPCFIDGLIRNTILSPITKEGYVYILRAPGYFAKNYPKQQPWVKIGMSIDVKSRIRELKASCGLFDLEEVGCVGMPHKWYYKVEALVHNELANFKRVFDCGKCKSKTGGSTKHNEWFAVPEEVAQQVVKRWLNFVRMEPYDDNGIIKDKWSKIVEQRNMIQQKDDEKHDDHGKRNHRWNEMLEKGSNSV